MEIYFPLSTTLTSIFSLTLPNTQFIAHKGNVKHNVSTHSFFNTNAPAWPMAHLDLIAICYRFIQKLIV